MASLRRVVLLLLLAAGGSNAAPAASECETRRLPTRDLQKVFGDWVLVWSVTDWEKGVELLASVSSSHVQLQPRPDNRTIQYDERNKYSNDSCSVYFVNMTRPSATEGEEYHTLHADSIRMERDGVVEPYNETGDVDFYETSADSLLMVYRASTSRFLLSYKREGSHRDLDQLRADHAPLKRLAECLGLPHDKPFIYDGVADFCHKKSAPDQSPGSDQS